jgi:hypothetical protein
MRATRHASFDRELHSYRRTSTIVEQAAGAGLRPTATNGLRMAIQPGRGEARVPVRSAFAGAVVGVAGVTAALVFAASLSHLVATPHLYGWTWDAKVEVDAPKGLCGDGVDHGLSRRAGVDAVAEVCFFEMEVGGRPVTVWGFRSVHGTVDPEVVAGRAPRGPNEIALGSVTLDALHKHIGDTVKAQGNRKAREYEIVGQIVLPTIGSPQPLADGAAMTAAGWAPLNSPGENETDFLVVRADPGDPAAADRAVKSLARTTVPHAKNLGTSTLPVEITRLQQIDQIPLLVAALLGFFALLAVGYALVTAVRRRRHELAVLKILGFDRGQVRATVAWQSTVLGAVGLVLGIPLGIIGGRLAWHLVAISLGISTDVTTPALWLIVSVPCTLAFVNLVAYLPGRAAARTAPAVALRTD